MELSHLDEFIALASSLNFTETAERLHLAQPTLSKHMSALEHELGARLFSRSSSHVELTEEGFYFLGVAHNVRSELDRAKRTFAEIRLRKPIYIDGRFDDPLISGAVSSTIAFSNENSSLISFNHDHSRPAFEQLCDDSIDLLIDILPLQDVSDQDLICRPLFTRPLMAIVDRSHSLAARESLEVRDLDGATLVRMMNAGFESGWDKIVALCAKAGFEPRYVTLPVQSMAEGIALAPRESVLLYPGASKELRFLERAHKVAVPITGKGAEFVTYAIYKRINEERLAPFVNRLIENVTAEEGDADARGNSR
jgi:DNA-binding transcriptional LysR family regulator